MFPQIKCFFRYFSLTPIRRSLGLTLTIGTVKQRPRLYRRLRSDVSKTVGLARFLSLPLFPFVFLALFALAGCPRNGGQSKGGTESLPQTQEQPAADLFTIRYRLKWLYQAQFAGVFMAQEKGFYARQGLNVEILPGGLEYPPYQSLISGSADVTSINLIYAIHNYHSGPGVVNLAQISQKNSTLLVGKKTSGIKTLRDLRGKKVGVWRDESGEYVRHFLEEQNLGIQVVPIEWSVSLLLSDAVDMMNVMDYNEYHRILMAGLDEDELVTFNLGDYGFDIIDDGLYTTRDFYALHPEQCRAFANATLEGWKYALEHREETLDVVLKYQKMAHLPANRSHQAWMLDKMRDRVMENPDKLGWLDPADFERAQAILLRYKLLSQPVDYHEFYPQETK